MNLDLEAFVNLTRESAHHSNSEIRDLFDRSRPVTVSRAPGRLDVMGGIADYSGSLVLQRPLCEATFVALQPSREPVLRIVSFRPEIRESPRVFTMGLDQLASGGQPASYEAVRGFLTAVPETRWAAYVVGVFHVLMRERDAGFTQGARILVASSVPEGKGVASSAAVEVATMRAVVDAYGIDLDSRDEALLCQYAENRVAGAPCGVMDQMASLFGREDCLMALRCQPAELESPVPIPPPLQFWGMDSGERHAVGGSSYESVRAGAFMGARIVSGISSEWSGYLANLSPEEFERELRPSLPEEISGRDFIDRYGKTEDTVTSVNPGWVYKILQPTAHPVYENHRVQEFREILSGTQGEKEWTRLGELMYESHASYVACGLGSEGTNLIVDLVRKEGPSSGLYGARITGGGSGGTVAILGSARAAGAVSRIQEEYAARTGYRPAVFSGTSDGAKIFGSIGLTL